MEQEPNLAQELDRAIGARVRHVRKLRGMTQTELGESLGVTFQQIQKYERGTNRISTSALILLAQALNVSPSALLGTEEQGRPDLDMSLLSDDGAYELVQAVAQISSDKLRRMVIELAQSLAGSERSRRRKALGAPEASAAASFEARN